jgi:hypothetical protein
MLPKSHTHKRCRTLRKKSFSTRRYAEIHIHGHFLTIEKTYKELLN